MMISHKIIESTSLDPQLISDCTFYQQLSIAKEKKPLIEAGWTPPYLVRPRVNSSNGKSIVCYDKPITIIVDMEFTIPNSNSKGLRHYAV